jgi:23S rRNA (cytosine1962-C5)-methyltransferase
MKQSLREVVLCPDRGIGARIARGHPWIWREGIAQGLGGAQAGEQVQVNAADGTPIGRGLADPSSPIAVRIWTHGRRPIDDALWLERLQHASALRAMALPPGRCNAYRLVNGEGDRMPGFVVDCYASVAVLRTDGEAAGSRVDEFARLLQPTLDGLGVPTLVHRTGAKGDVPRLRVLRGPAPPETIAVYENGVPFFVDLAHGQKTGAFLDQRENRIRVGELARGRRVLNLFSYAGGFSLHAALGGSHEVTSVDTATAAHATASASFRAAGVDPSEHVFVTAEVGAFLEAARSRKQMWDLIVSDPPSFAPNEKAMRRALSAYRALHRACVEVLAPGGILCAASCSSHIDAEAFLETLDDATFAPRALSLLELRGAGPDHPTVPAFPEGRYLKFAILG